MAEERITTAELQRIENHMARLPKEQLLRYAEDNMPRLVAEVRRLQRLIAALHYLEPQIRVGSWELEHEAIRLEVLDLDGHVLRPLMREAQTIREEQAHADQ